MNRSLFRQLRLERNGSVLVKSGRICDGLHMGGLHKSAASIGFYGDDLDPAEITAALDAEPTVGVRAGGLWRTKLGVEKVAARGSWRLESERREPGNLDCQINQLLDGLSNDHLAWQSFARRFRGRVFCGLFLACGNEGLTIQSKTLARLGERGLLLDLDIYGPDDLN